jgi:RNA polymerase sigma factor (sigma-70 family)
MSVAMAGEKQNIIQAVKDYGRQLFGFIRKRVSSEEDAEDILQDVWYQLSSQTKSEDIISLSGWLYRVAKNRITDNYRRKKENSLEDMMMSEDEDGEWRLPEIMLTEEASPETIQLQQLFKEELADALNELPENQRNVFILNELEDITLQEIADRERENIKTIISRKRYAIQYLRKRLEYLSNEFFNE